MIDSQTVVGKNRRAMPRKNRDLVDRGRLLKTRMRSTYGRLIILAGGLVAVMIGVLIATATGIRELSLKQIGIIVFHPLLPLNPLDYVTNLEMTIIRELRLPRTLMAVVGGAGMATAGAAMQGITRNPLVSPFTVGISPAAAFGASLAIFFGVLQVPVFGPYLLVLAAFASAMLCAMVVLGLAALRGVSSIMIILAGVGLTYFFSALTATMQFLATEEQLSAIVHWTFGSLNRSDWNQVVVISVVFACFFPLVAQMAWAFNALGAGGDDMAVSLGYNVKRIRLLTSFFSVLMTASVVSFTGVIGFVGLVAPHIARMLIGSDHRYLIPFASIVGALLLLAADTVGRSVFSPAVMPVGIVVAYLGVPIFIHLIITRRKDYF